MKKHDALQLLMRMINEYEEFGYVHSKLSSLYELYNYISTLGEKNLDPETGLMPCGCGGKAIRRCYDDDTPHGPLFIVQCADCTMCTILPSHTQNDADKIWNRAMGYREVEK